MAIPLSRIEGIGPKYSSLLAGAGILTTTDLLEHCGPRDGRERISCQTSISVDRLRQWAGMADLMRISGIGSQHAELLEACGVGNVVGLGRQAPDRLSRELRRVNEFKSLARSVPSVGKLAAWIEQAKRVRTRVSV